MKVELKVNGQAVTADVPPNTLLVEFIREHLQLNRPIYARTAAYGHFGRQPDNEGGFSWEKTDLVDQLKSLA